MLDLPALVLLTESRLYVAEASAGGLDIAHALAALGPRARRASSPSSCSFVAVNSAGGGASGGKFGGGAAAPLAATRWRPRGSHQMIPRRFTSR